VNRVFSSESERAAYWKQRALSAEGQIPGDACVAGARAIHRQTDYAHIPFDDLTPGIRWRMEWYAFGAISAVNHARLQRLPHDHPERQEVSP
jgi:hypothetical protein